jgi:hypothetical protein
MARSSPVVYSRKLSVKNEIAMKAEKIYINVTMFGSMVDRVGIQLLSLVISI